MRSEIVTILGPYAETNALANLLSQRHIVVQLDPAYARHLASPMMSKADYIIIPSKTEDLELVLHKVIPSMHSTGTLILYGSLPNGSVRSTLGPRLVDNKLRGGILIPDMDGFIVAGLDSISANSSQRMASMCQDLLAQYQVVSSPEAADCLIRYREGRRRLLQAWQEEMRSFCEDAGVDTAEVLPTSTRIPGGIRTGGAHDVEARPEQDWRGSMLAGAVQQVNARPALEARRLMDDVRRVKEAGRDDGRKQTPQVLVVGYDPSFIEELCKADQVSVQVILPAETWRRERPHTPRLPEWASQFAGVWTAEHLTRFDAIAVLAESAEHDMDLLQEVDGEGVFVEWLC